jgi:hypothetical protein
MECLNVKLFKDTDFERLDLLPNIKKKCEDIYQKQPTQEIKI